MQLGKYFLSPTERKRYSINYSDWLDTGESVQSVNYAVSPSSGNPLSIAANAVQPGDTSNVFYATGADAGTFKVTVTMVTSAGQERIDTVQYTVKAQ